MDSSRFLDQMLVSVINAREVECARVSKLLHDHVGQVLSAVGLQLDVLRLDFGDRVPELAGRTAEMQNLLEQANKLIRDLSFELHPAVVERAGLLFAIEHLVNKFRVNFGGGMRLLSDPSVHVPLEVGNAFYKIAEQALENAVAHAGANKIEVLLRPSQQAITLEIRDNGKGFPYNEIRQRASGLGLLLMEHYATQAKLRYSIKSTPGKGTIIKASYDKKPAEQTP